MQLPAALRTAIDHALEGVPLASLRQAADELSHKYREDRPATVAHLSSQTLARAYLAARLPATYAAVRQSMEWTRELLPGFAPKTLLDVGSGPGTALFAAAGAWPGIEQAVLLEASPSIRAEGERLLQAMALGARTEWRTADLAQPLAQERADLVVCAYVLTELPEAVRMGLIQSLWAASSGVLLLVEPGTTSGWTRILAARAQLIAAGARIVAPCPHEQPCPLIAPDWCHFARRVERSRMHRLVKQGEASWEDEKFIYLAVARTSAAHVDARILTRPAASKGRIDLKLCKADGSASVDQLNKRDPRYKAARRADWGDALLPSDAFLTRTEDEAE